MNQRVWFICVFILLMVLPTGTVQAAAQCSMSGESLSGTATDRLSAHLFEHSYDSGARWSMCVFIDDQSGLGVSQVYYGAPNDESRKVLESASLAQILFKYDEDTRAQHWLSSYGLGASKQLDIGLDRCAGGEIESALNGPIYCVQHHNLNALTSLRRSESRRRHAFTLHAWSKVNAFVVEQVWEFSEDGQISPMVRIGGVLSRFTDNTRYGSDIDLNGHYAGNATVVSTWKLDFNINDTPNNDIVESVAFVPHVSNVVRRSITVKPVETESLHTVNREQYKGWLIRDRDVSAGANRDTRIGYYLDPQVSGFSYKSRRDNWSVFDLAVSNNKSCEKLASGNRVHNAGCGDTLDDFVNGESLQDTDPVIWFSVARQFLPKKEDYPALSVRESRFTLLPFDWSATTPFAPLLE